MIALAPPDDAAERRFDHANQTLVEVPADQLVAAPHGGDELVVARPVGDPGRERLGPDDPERLARIVRSEGVVGEGGRCGHSRRE